MTQFVVQGFFTDLLPWGNPPCDFHKKCTDSFTSIVLSRAYLALSRDTLQVEQWRPLMIIFQDLMVPKRFLVQDYVNPLIRSNHPHANPMSVIL
jgi:hypothetical protein